MSQRITLNKLKIENFKGIKSFELDLAGKDMEIAAENGVGKTTIYDAPLYLLFGKDSTGRKDFEVRPLDRRNKPLKGVVLMVEAEFDIDGTAHVFKKENHEKVVKGQLRGYETLCWIDEVPKKISEYTAYIAELIPEDTFKLLTDLHFFNEKMHWNARRKVLKDIAGDIGTPQGFDELMGELNGRSLKDYKDLLTAQKKRHTKERDEINPRCDEILKGLSHPDCDVTAVTDKRDVLNVSINKTKTIRTELLGRESERQNMHTKVTELTRQKLMRESDLQNDMSAVQALIDERTKLLDGVSYDEQIVITALRQLDTAKGEKLTAEHELQQSLRTLNKIRDEYTKASESPGTLLCFACGQDLPEDKLAENKSKRLKALGEMTKQGNDLKKEVDEKRLLIGELETKIKLFTKTFDNSEEMFKLESKKAELRLEAIDKEITARPKPKPEADGVWQAIDADIKKVEAEIGPPVTEQLTALEQELTTLESELETVNNTLAQADRIEQDRKRIAELEDREKELAQCLADIEKLLTDIQLYNAEESNLLTAAVNGKFAVTKFKMFDELLNGTLEPCCVAMLNGVPAPDMSSGQKIFVGIDIVNVLSEHYGISVTLFIDHAESMTLPIEAKSQVIKLRAVEGVKELRTEVLERKAGV